jgi:hypothetical protein
MQSSHIGLAIISKVCRILDILPQFLWHYEQLLMIARILCMPAIQEFEKNAHGKRAWFNLGVVYSKVRSRGLA